jgi:hypothetical protein
VAASQEPQWQDSMVRHVKAEPKKAVALTLLVVVLIAMWAKIFVLDEATPAAVAGSRGPGTGIGRPDSLKGPTSPGGRALIEWTKKPITGTKRNLFAIKLDYFPVDGSRPIFTGDDGDGFWDQLAKSLAAKADQEKAKGILLDNVRLQASRLDLQTIVMRDGAPQAMVNRRMVQEGDTIEGFRIVRIEAKRIVVEREGVKVEVVFKH